MKKAFPFLPFATAALVTVGLLQADQTNEIGKLLADDATPKDLLGSAVAVSGSIVAVGAEGDDQNGPLAGSAYTFDLSTGQQLAKLIPNTGSVFDLFGCSIGVSGTTVIVGVRGDDDNGTESGSAYLYDAITGQELAHIFPNDGMAYDQFGSAVAVDGTTAVIGAFANSDLGTSAGAAYLFDTVTGQQLMKLTASDGAAGDQFGIAVAIEGSNLVVGNSGNNLGAVYLFDTLTGQEKAKFMASDGVLGDLFGEKIAISGNTLIVGACRHGLGGAAYLFDLTTSLELHKLVSNDIAMDDEFGSSVAIDGTIAIVGAEQDDDFGSYSGSAYVFDSLTGVQTAKLLPSDGVSSDRFGQRVAIVGSTALIGSPDSDEGFVDAGAVYIFDAATPSGLASTLVRNGSGSNAMILASRTNPVLGATWDSDLDCTGHSPSFASIEVYSQPFGGFFLSGGELLVDVTSPLLARAISIHYGNVLTFSLSIPPDGSLCGMTASAQGGVLGLPGFDLSNAIDLVLGY